MKKIKNESGSELVMERENTTEEAIMLKTEFKLASVRDAMNHISDAVFGITNKKYSLIDSGKEKLDPLWRDLHNYIEKQMRVLDTLYRLSEDLEITNEEEARKAMKHLDIYIANFLVKKFIPAIRSGIEKDKSMTGYDLPVEHGRALEYLSKTEEFLLNLK